jgi:hypothetical protein
MEAHNATERPDVHGAMAASGAAANYLGRHVHGCASHRILAALTGVDGSESSTLSGDELCGAEINVFDYTVMIEENVWRKC